MKELRWIPVGIVAAAALFASAAMAQDAGTGDQTAPTTTSPQMPTYGPTGPTYPGAPGMPPGYPGPTYPGYPTTPGGPTYVPGQTGPQGSTISQPGGPGSRIRPRTPRSAATKRGETATESESDTGSESTRGGAGAGGAGGAGGGGGLQEFETGIEYRRPSGRFTFNLEDADLPDLVRLVSNITGKRFIYGGKIRSIKASVFAPTKVTSDEAYRAFLSILELNGLTIVPSGRYLKIIDSQDSRTAPLPLYRPGEAAPNDDRMVTRLHRLGFTSAEDVAEVLGHFKSAEGDITAYAPTNTLIITDTAANIRRMLEITGEIDVQGTGEQVWVEPIHYVPASEMAETLLSIFEATAGASDTRKSRPASARRPAKNAGGAAAAGGGPEPATVGESSQVSRLSKIIPDDRTNSLIIVATQPAYLRILELIRRLDVPESEAGGDIHVHMLQHADAEELSGVLQALQGGGARRAPAKRGGGEGSAAPAAGVAEGQAFEGDVRISPDKATNSLVIVSSLRDYASLRQVINRLDVARRQVFVEAVIMEVSLSRVRRLGLAFHGGSMIDTGGEDSLLLGGTAYPQDGPIPFSSIILDPTSLTGLAVGLRGPEIAGTEDLLAPGVSIPAFGVALQALQTDNDVNVLSTPNLLATDNTPAEISVGQNVPVQQGFLPGIGALAGAAGAAQQGNIGGALGALGGLGGVAGAVGRQNVGLTLKMTPHVNDSDEVRIELELEVSEVLDRGNINPTISQRIAKTMLSVRDQQTVVLGGLIRDGESEHADKVPILGDIPILGFFFRRTVHTNEKTNLLIILTPYIIRDMADFRRIFYQKMEERREFIERYTSFEARDYEPDLDYSRTNGVVEEVNRAMRDAEAEAELMQQLESQPPPEHVPGEPVSVPPALTGPGGGEEGAGEGGGEENAPVEGGPETTPGSTLGPTGAPEPPPPPEGGQ